MRLHTQFGILLSALCLGACANIPAHEYVPDAARDHITSTEVVAPVQQSEIYVFVPDSQAAAAGGGGLLLALVDAGVNSIRTSKAEAAVRPLRDALLDYNFDEMLQADLKTSLSQDSWLHVSNVHVLKEATNDSLDNALAASNAAVVLFTAIDYHLSNDADVLTITMTASLFAKDQALAALKKRATSGPKTAVGNALYHNTFVFETAAPGNTIDRDHNIAALSAQNGASMRALLKLGEAKLAYMLAADLQRTAADSDPAAFSNDPDGSIVRQQNGTLKFTAKPAL